MIRSPCSEVSPIPSAVDSAMRKLLSTRSPRSRSSQDAADPVHWHGASQGLLTAEEWFVARRSPNAVSGIATNLRETADLLDDLDGSSIRADSEGQQPLAHVSDAPADRDARRLGHRERTRVELGRLVLRASQRSHVFRVFVTDRPTPTGRWQAWGPPPQVPRRGTLPRVSRGSGVVQDLAPGNLTYDLRTDAGPQSARALRTDGRHPVGQLPPRRRWWRPQPHRHTRPGCHCTGPAPGRVVPREAPRHAQDAVQVA